MTRTVTAAEARRERGRQEMWQAVLTAARRIVQEDGIDALSMRAVARAIGYSPAALYEYCPGKDAVLTALYFEGAEGLSGRMRQALDALPPDATPPEALKALGRAYRAYALEQPELYRLVFTARREDAGTTKPAFAASREGFDILVDTARAGVEKGAFRPLSPLLIAVAAWSAVHGFVSLELSSHLMGGPRPGEPPASEGDGPAARAAMFEATLDAVVAGLTTR